MKVIIAGSRDIYMGAVRISEELAAAGWVPTEIVSGTARGADASGEAWAVRNNVKLVKFPADWNGLGKRAGYVRNAQMADYADALLAIWDGESPGTRSMIDLAKSKGLKVRIVFI